MTMKKVSTYPLTAKQIAFADGVASGMNRSDSYRAAYNAGSMKPASIHVNACKLAATAKVALRIQSQIEQREQRRYVVELSDRDRVLTKLRDLMDKADTQAVQLQAATWLGKSASMFTDVTMDKPAAVDIAQIDKEIAARIAELEATKH